MATTQQWTWAKLLGRELRRADQACYPHDKLVPYEELGCEQSAYDFMAAAAIKFLTDNPPDEYGKGVPPIPPDISMPPVKPPRDEGVAR